MKLSFDQLAQIDIRQFESQRKQKLLARVAFTFASILATYLIIITALMPGISTAKILGVVATALLFAISYYSNLVGMVPAQRLWSPSPW